MHTSNGIFVQKETTVPVKTQELWLFLSNQVKWIFPSASLLAHNRINDSVK